MVKNKKKALKRIHLKKKLKQQNLLKLLVTNNQIETLKY